jgi:hypothetical protein
MLFFVQKPMYVFHLDFKVLSRNINGGIQLKSCGGQPTADCGQKYGEV